MITIIVRIIMYVFQKHRRIHANRYVRVCVSLSFFSFFTETDTIVRGHTGIESICTYHIYIFIYVHFFIDLYVYNHIDVSFGVSLGVYILQNSRQPFNRSTDLGYGYKLPSGMKVRATLKFRNYSARTRVLSFKVTENSLYCTFSLLSRILRRM